MQKLFHWIFVRLMRLIAEDVMFDEDPATGEKIEKEDYSGPNLVAMSDFLR